MKINEINRFGEVEILFSEPFLVPNDLPSLSGARLLESSSKKAENTPALELTV